MLIYTGFSQGLLLVCLGTKVERRTVVFQGSGQVLSSTYVLIFFLSRFRRSILTAV